MLTLKCEIEFYFLLFIILYVSKTFQSFCKKKFKVGTLTISWSTSHNSFVVQKKGEKSIDTPKEVYSFVLLRNILMMIIHFMTEKSV